MLVRLRARFGSGFTRRTGLLLLLLAAAVPAASVRAQALDLIFYRPSAAPSSALTLESPVVPAATAFQLGAAIDYAHGLLDRVVACPASATVVDSSCVTGSKDGRTSVVTDLMQLDVLAALSLRDAVTLAAALPLVLARAADDLQKPSRIAPRAGLGDLRLSLTAPLVQGGWPLALTFESTFPTASHGAHDVFSGVHGVSVTPALVVAHALGKLTLSAKLGYRAMRRSHVLDYEQDDAFVLGFGATYAVLPDLALLGELRSQLGVGSRSSGPSQRPVEIDLGLRLPGPLATQLTLGTGVAAWPGDAGIGAPSVRVFAAVTGSLTAAPCQGSGCAAADADHDGIPDASDACPHDAEDHDGFADDDGCPDPDNDADGIPDAKDLCPLRSEDRDAYEDSDGCPEPDNDADGIPDGADACRFDPEDRDGFEDEDGCPEPGPQKTSISVEGTRILVSDRIYFEDDADTIRSVSRPVLDELARVLVPLVRTQRVRIEGYTDNVGSADYNTDLSYRRAKAVVEYLVARGVPADRLEYTGYGPAKPLAPNDTPEGRALNRRVELVVLPGS